MSYYIYINSGATGRRETRPITLESDERWVDYSIKLSIKPDTKGFVLGYPKDINPIKREKGKKYNAVMTTSEFAFAKEFKTLKRQKLSIVRMDYPESY
jgi:hypothetical protein